MGWRVARSLERLREQVDARYGGRSTVSDGTIGDADHSNRDSDHNPWYRGHIVTAMDITHDPKAGVDIDQLTDELTASRDSRIKYLIANGLILDSRPGNTPWEWVSYTGPNPHRTHMHISVMADDSADDTSDWDLPSLSGDSGSTEDKMDFGDLQLSAYRGVSDVMADIGNPDAHAYRRAKNLREPLGLDDMAERIETLTEMVEALVEKTNAAEGEGEPKSERKRDKDKDKGKDE